MLEFANGLIYVVMQQLSRVGMQIPNNAESFIQKYSIPVIVLFTFLVWSPVLLVHFINDDYQILGYHAGKSFSNIFQPFWQPDISGVYWRPAGNLIHPLVLYIAGFHPFPFRVVSLLSYIFCCLIFYFACGKSGLSKKASLLAALLFAALPSHELQVAWIADTGESLVTAFLLMTFIFYENIYKMVKSRLVYILLTVISFFIALLIKEVAFAGVLIPFFALILHGDYKKFNVTRAIRDFIFGVIILAAVLIYRYLVVGGTPFVSSHFQNSGPFKWIMNFFVYLLLSVFPPETLEAIQYYSDAFYFMILTIILLIILLYGFIKAMKRMNPNSRRIVFAGMMWFIIFVLPALPTLMRWYVFTASAGILLISGGVIEYLSTRRYRIGFITGLLLFIVAISVYDFILMIRWKDVSYQFSKAYNYLQTTTPDKKMTIWGVPDKVNRIPMMKLGIAETVRSAMNDSTISVYAPLRMELTGALSSMKVDSVSNSIMKFRLRGGRFLVERGQSKSIIKGEQINEVYEGYRFVINNSELESTAVVHFDSLKGTQYYYDGSRFRKVLPRFKLTNIK